MKRLAVTGLVAGWCILTTGGHASAASPLEIQRGQQFFNARHGGDWSCATCHTSDPRQPGKHATTGKAIAPLAPAGNPDRFTSPARVEKWFRRNCNDVLWRACTPLEKGDVLAWLMSLGR
jgi:mono/diheme cytochrome c family protein